MSALGSIEAEAIGANAAGLKVGEWPKTYTELGTAARAVKDKEKALAFMQNFGDRVFEFEMGQTIAPPSGAAIVDGQQLTMIINTNPPTQPANLVSTVFEFDNNNTFVAAPGKVRVPFTSVQSYTVDKSISFLLIPVLGGVRSLWGVVLGAMFVTILPELLSQIGDIHQILFGLALVAVVVLLPDGLVGLLKQLAGKLGWLRANA